MPIYEASDLGISPQEWDSLVAGDSHGHLLQTWAWGDAKKTFGWQVKRWVIKTENKLVGGAQVLFQRQGPFLLAYLPKGPFFVDQDPLIVQALWQGIHQRCRRIGAFSIKLEPEWENIAQDRLDWLAHNGFIPSPITIQPRSTVVVDLLASEEAILARMKQKWRYNIRLSERKGVEVRQVGDAELEVFYSLMQTTGQRAQFGIHSLEYYRHILHLFSINNRAQLLLAYYQGEPLAGLMLFTFNQQAWYLYGASSDTHRELMPNQLLQWRAMQQAKRQGCRQYDLWGIKDTEATLEADDLSGVGRFKLGFGGRVVRYVGAYDHIYNKLLYWVGIRYWLWNRRRRMKPTGSETA
jgi:peptidoglycan pentaglycine glycine transferase (the first glycine)